MGRPTGGDPAVVAQLFDGLRAVVFDFDGVLVDSVGVKSEAFAALYPQETDEFRTAVVSYHLEHGGISRVHKITHFEEMRSGQTPPAQKVRALVDQFASVVTQRVISAPEMDGAEELLGHLAEQLPLFVCSGTPQPELREIVRARGWEHFFTGVFGSPDEKPTILHRIVAGLGCPSQSVLMIGDAQGDLHSAALAGTRFLFVSDEPGVTTGATATAKSPSDIVQALAKARLTHQDRATP